MRLLFVFLFLLGLLSCGVNKKSLAKQPNCKDIEGVNDCDADQHKEKFKNHSGIIKCCKNGKVRGFLTIKDGKQDGLRRSWHENGQLMREGNFKDGLQRWWYENGQMKSEYNYIDDKVEGLRRDWYENGQLEYEDYYKNGKQDGLQRFWYENGQLEYEMNYKDGTRLSKKCWDEEGNEIECW